MELHCSTLVPGINQCQNICLSNHIPKEMHWWFHHLHSALNVEFHVLRSLLIQHGRSTPPPIPWGQKSCISPHTHSNLFTNMQMRTLSLTFPTGNRSPFHAGKWNQFHMYDKGRGFPMRTCSRKISFSACVLEAVGNSQGNLINGMGKSWNFPTGEWHVFSSWWLDSE